MEIDKNSTFYINARKRIQEYIANGGDIDRLDSKHPLYKYIKNHKQGKGLTVDEKFALLGYTRNYQRESTIRQNLINKINAYLEAGGSFHIRRKNLPFFNHLRVYAQYLKEQGIEMSHEQIMREDLGYKQYSDLYFRSIGINHLAKYRDSEGFVDSYRDNRQFRLYISDLSITFGIPYYLTVTLLADEKLRDYEVSLDKVAYTKQILTNYVREHGSFVGITLKNKKIYDEFCYLIRHFSDGTQQKFSRIEWLEIFGLADFDHKFSEETSGAEVDVTEIMQRLKREYGEEFVLTKNINSMDYSKILRKAIELDISVEDLFRMYEINYAGTARSRLSAVKLNHVPYLKEMKNLRDALMEGYGVKMSAGFTKEEVFEAKVKAVKTVYAEFKDRLEHYLPTSCCLEEKKKGTDL